MAARKFTRADLASFVKAWVSVGRRQVEEAQRARGPVLVQDLPPGYNVSVCTSLDVIEELLEELEKVETPR